jgi:hypothetical protein
MTVVNWAFLPLVTDFFVRFYLDQSTFDVNTTMPTLRYNNFFLLVIIQLLTLCLVTKTAVAKEEDVAVLKQLTTQLSEAAITLRGDDARFVRWDVTNHTATMQTTTCPIAFPMALNAVITYVNPMSSHLYELDYIQKQPEVDLLAAALEVCILCITNHPVNRATFSDQQHAEQSYTIHASIVTLLHVPELAAPAAHLVWIATYANANNHARFLHAKVIPALSTLILNAPGPDDDAQHSPARTIMWAAAALQNLAASYCTSSDGGCYWEWAHDEASNEPFLQLAPDSGELLVDGTEVRLAVTPSLLLRLLQWSCHGPVTGHMSPDHNPFPGENAESTRLEHAQSRNIVPWAATGALANIALNTALGQHMAHDYGDVMPCFCYMAQSPDWLEAAKGQIMLHHLRPDAETCCILDVGEDEDEAHSLCVDQVFLDAEGNSCAEYTDAVTEEDCQTPDASDASRLATAACCHCGGGDTYVGQQDYRASLHEPVEEWDEEASEVVEGEEEEEGEFEEEL